jgi:hypothetical protein
MGVTPLLERGQAPWGGELAVRCTGHLLQHADEVVDADIGAGVAEESGELGVEVLREG